MGTLTIDSTGSTKSLSGSHSRCSIVGVRLGYGRVGIVDIGAKSQTVSSDVSDIGVVKDRGTCLDDKYGDIRLLRQAIRDDETAGTTTNNDIVVLGGASTGGHGSCKEGRNKVLHDDESNRAYNLDAHPS